MTRLKRQRFQQARTTSIMIDQTESSGSVVETSGQVSPKVSARTFLLATSTLRFVQYPHHFNANGDISWWDENKKDIERFIIQCVVILIDI